VEESTFRGGLADKPITEVADMSRPYSFQIPEATEKELNKYIGGHSRRDSWKRYTDPDTYDHAPSDASPDWPCVLNAFVEWYERNGALPKLLRENYNRDVTHGGDDDPRRLNALITATEKAFADFYTLWEWSLEVWEHDPVIRAHFDRRPDPDNPAGLQCVNGTEVADQEGGE